MGGAAAARRLDWCGDGAAGVRGFGGGFELKGFGGFSCGFPVCVVLVWWGDCLQ